MTTLEAIKVLRQRGYSASLIIATAKEAVEFEKTFFGETVTHAQALVRYVQETRYLPFCRNCRGVHDIQQCPEVLDRLFA